MQERFQELMRDLWSVMHIDLDKGTETEVYSIMFANEVEVHLISTQPGKIDIISEAGLLRRADASQALLGLIALNRPPLAVNVDKDSGEVMVWARQEIDDLDVDSLIELISELVKVVYLARNCIDCQDAQELIRPSIERPGMPVMARGEGTLAQLRRRN